MACKVSILCVLVMIVILVIEFQTADGKSHKGSHGSKNIKNHNRKSSVISYKQSTKPKNKKPSHKHPANGIPHHTKGPEKGSKNEKHPTNGKPHSTKGPGKGSKTEKPPKSGIPDPSKGPVKDKNPERQSKGVKPQPTKGPVDVRNNRTEGHREGPTAEKHPVGNKHNRTEDHGKSPKTEKLPVDNKQNKEESKTRPVEVRNTPPTKYGLNYSTPATPRIPHTTTTPPNRGVNISERPDTTIISHKNKTSGRDPHTDDLSTDPTVKSTFSSQGTNPKGSATRKPVQVTATNGNSPGGQHYNNTPEYPHHPINQSPYGVQVPNNAMYSSNTVIINNNNNWHYTAPVYHKEDTGKTEIGIYLGYHLANVKTPSYHYHNYYYVNKAPVFDHYTIHHYYHNRKVPKKVDVTADSIPGCLGDSGSFCPNNTASLCLDSGSVLCVADSMFMSKCDNNVNATNCVSSTISYKTDDGKNITSSVQLPCISYVHIFGNITTVNHNIVKVNASTNATYITSTPKKPIVPHIYCVTVLATPAKRVLTPGEQLASNAKKMFSSFLVNALGVE